MMNTFRKNKVSKITDNFLLKISYARAVALRNAFFNLFLLQVQS